MSADAAGAHGRPDGADRMCRAQVAQAWPVLGRGRDDGGHGARRAASRRPQPVRFRDPLLRLPPRLLADASSQTGPGTAELRQPTPAQAGQAGQEGDLSRWVVNQTSVRAEVQAEEPRQAKPRIGWARHGLDQPGQAAACGQFRVIFCWALSCPGAKGGTSGHGVQGSERPSASRDVSTTTITSTARLAPNPRYPTRCC